jgi:hypothetical protein
MIPLAGGSICSPAFQLTIVLNATSLRPSVWKKWSALWTLLGEKNYYHCAGLQQCVPTAVGSILEDWIVRAVTQNVTAVPIVAKSALARAQESM